MVTSGQDTDLAQQGSNLGDLQVCNPPKECLGCLAASALATELTADQSSALFNVVEVRKLAKHETLISEGDTTIAGMLSPGVNSNSPEMARRQDVLCRLERGTITGELAVVDGLKRTASVKAVDDDCCVIALHRHQLESLISADPSLVYKVMRSVVVRRTGR